MFIEYLVSIKIKHLSKQEQQVYGFFEHGASRASKLLSEHERVLSQPMFMYSLNKPLLVNVERRVDDGV